MGTAIKKFKLASIVMLFTCASLLFAGGCARYAHTVNALYVPSATVRGGSGEIYIVIPENRQTRSTGIKWVIGKVTATDNRSIDELFSPRSPAEIIQGAFGQEFKKGGYTVIPVSKLPEAGQLVIDLTKAEIELDQVSALGNLKATCRVVAGMDVIRNGQLVKRVQYESTASRTDIRDRDMIAAIVLEDALESVMLQAVPEMHGLFKR